MTRPWIIASQKTARYLASAYDLPFWTSREADAHRFADEREARNFAAARLSGDAAVVRVGPALPDYPER